MPQISVIVPVYKVEPYLRRCVDSILGQTFTDFELILVDDGSPDNCPAICDEYAAKDTRVHVIHQENGGLSAARNAGIDWVFDNSASQWLTFIDSDDWVHKDYLLHLQETAFETKCLVCVCGLWRTDGAALPEDNEYHSECLSADTFYCDYASDNMSPASSCGKLFHKSLFQTLRFPLGKLHEDEFTTYVAIYQAKRIGVYAARLYAYYTNPSGIMHSQWSPRRLDAVEAYEQQMAFARRNNNKRLFTRILRLYTINLTMQCIQISELEQAANQGFQRYCRILHKKLRIALRHANKNNLFPFSDPTNTWIYFQAYPARTVWLNKIKAVLRIKQ